MRDLTQQLLAIFQTEYKEHLARIRGILDIVSRGEGELSGPALDEAFRRAHSLKGAARAVGLQSVERLSHRLEAVFAAIRDGRVAFDRAMIPTFHFSVDALDDAVAGGDTAQALQTLSGLLEPSTATPTPVPVAAQPPVPPSISNEAPPAREFVPAVADSIRVSTGGLDRILNLTEELAVEVGRQDAFGERLSALVRDCSRIGREQGELRSRTGPQLRLMTAHPQFSSVSPYLNYLEHQLHSLTQTCRQLATERQRNAWNFRRLAEDLQDTAQQIRMSPAESYYDGFGKMVRGLARSEGKEVNFAVSGLDTYADRRVLEALKDPIMHMLRNAVGHAIEKPEARLRRGKLASGLVRLSLEAAGGMLVIAIEDDGSGIDQSRIARLAVTRGLLSDSEAMAKSRADMGRLIFQPGFSTAEGVTELSGRGMGLSVVQDAVQRLQGHINVSDNHLGGATFTITAPLAISRLHTLMVSCGGEIFGIPAHCVERIYRADLRRDFGFAEGRRFFIRDGAQAPVYSLPALLGLEPAAESGPRLPVLIVRANGRIAALAVDEVLAARQSVLQELGPASVFGRKAAGVIVLEDGAAAVILNLAAVLDPMRTEADTWPKQAPAVPEQRRSSTILVVDDSMTTRALEKSLLESNGYGVSIAIDGVEALEILRDQRIDLVITDVEMPRMDGFALIQEMKAVEALASIPVIIVSSVEKREEQRRGLALGADAYIVKRTFEQQELLETIRQIL